jgi:GDPmannose 4,6-dehydratase
MKKALITGIAGQDGFYLSELLLEKGYEVYGLARSTSDTSNVSPKVIILEGDLGNPESIKNAVSKSNPDEVYNFAGVSDLKTAYADPDKTLELNYKSVEILLGEALKQNPKVRFLQASSSETFLPSANPLNEDSSRDWDTSNPYAKAKMMTDRDVIEKSRKEHGAFACSAILFNHESPQRSMKFVSRKIINTLVKIKYGLADSLSIGNIDMQRDWGFAGDYAEAMWQMLQIDEPVDLVLATGELHKVRDFIEITAKILNLKLTWHGEGADTFAVDSAGKKIVVVDPAFYKPLELYSKVVIGFAPKVSFEELVQMMVDADIKALNK